MVSDTVLIIIAILSFGGGFFLRHKLDGLHDRFRYGRKSN